MSYENFKAKIWSKAIDKELARACVFAADTNQQYSGEIKGIGDTVRILNVAKPTVAVHNMVDGDITLSAPEKVADTSVSLVVDRAAYFNYSVEDIDKAQGAGQVLSVLNDEASDEVASVIDQAIANLSHPDTKASGIQKFGASATVLSSANILSVLDGMQQKLFENDVPTTAKITVTLPPWAYVMFRQAYVQIDTDNSKKLENGEVARYSNMIIRMSNNVAKKTVSNKDHYYIQCKTNKAIALAMSESHTEPFRPEGGFKDAVKGFKLFGCKVVRPGEMVTLDCTAN